MRLIVISDDSSIKSYTESGLDLGGQNKSKEQFVPFCAVKAGSIPSWKHSHLKTIPWPPAAIYELLTNEKSVIP